MDCKRISEGLKNIEQTSHLTPARFKSLGQAADSRLAIVGYGGEAERSRSSLVEMSEANELEDQNDELGLLSAYELARERRIAANKAKLVALGLVDAAATMVQEAKQEAGKGEDDDDDDEDDTPLAAEAKRRAKASRSRKRKRAGEGAATAAPTRRSRRIAAAPADKAARVAAEAQDQLEREEAAAEAEKRFAKYDALIARHARRIARSGGGASLSSRDGRKIPQRATYVSAARGREVKRERRDHSP